MTPVVALRSLLRDGCGDAYDAAHARIPDDLVDAHLRAGIRDWTIWRSGRELFHLVEDMGVATGIDLDAMINAAATAERIVGRQLPSQVLRAGPRTPTTPA